MPENGLCRHGFCALSQRIMFSHKKQRLNPALTVQVRTLLQLQASTQGHNFVAPFHSQNKQRIALFSLATTDCPFYKTPTPKSQFCRAAWDFAARFVARPCKAKLSSQCRGLDEIEYKKRFKAYYGMMLVRNPKESHWSWFRPLHLNCPPFEIPASR